MGDRIVAVYGSSSAVPGDGVYEVGVELGRLLARAGFGVVNGGYSGLMEAVSAGAVGAGGRAIGVTAPSLFPGRPGGNSYLTEEIPAESLIDRIEVMSELACAYIAMPGSIGTMTELALAWNDAFLSVLRGVAPDPVIAFRQAWGRIVDRLTGDLRTTPGLITMVDTPGEAVDALARLAAQG